jgi:hypothetical protein
VSGLDFLNLYLTYMPIAIAADALFLTGGVALIRRWRRDKTPDRD